LACRDLLERALTLRAIPDVIGPRSPGSDVHSTFVEVGAWRLAHQLLGRETVVEHDGRRASLWYGLSSLLRASESGRAILADLGEVPAVDWASPPLATSRAASASMLDLGQSLATLRGLVLRKTRRGSAFTIDDFSAIDALSTLTAPELERRLSALAPQAIGSEEGAFSLAIVAYLLGRFDLCIAASLYCLDYDLDVEEYWHLLAFALRHVQRLPTHDAIVFAARRDRALLAELAPYRMHLSEHMG
jgi:hypothetical protein